MKLNMLQNALHSFYHALEHAIDADREPPSDRGFDENGHIISWRNEKGHESFYADGSYTKPPPSYGYKYAILHSIQALELLLKQFVDQHLPGSIFTSKNNNKTISLTQALEFTLQIDSDIFTESQCGLIIQAKNIRNFIEHYELQLEDVSVKNLFRDFAVLIVYTAYRLFGLKLTEYYSFDKWTDEGDPVGEILEYLLAESGYNKIESWHRMVELVRQHMSGEELLYCTNCFGKTISRSSTKCPVCGGEIDPELSETITEFERLSEKIRALKFGQTK